MIASSRVLAAMALAVAVVVPAAAQTEGSLKPLVGTWRVVGVDVAKTPVQAVVRDDPALLGAVLEVTNARLRWRPPHRSSSLKPDCDAPRLDAGAVRCRKGSFGPPGTRLVRTGNGLTLPWYDGATLRLSRVAPGADAGADAPVLTATGYDTIRIGGPPRAAGYTLSPNGPSASAQCRSLFDPKIRGLEVIAQRGVVTVIKARGFPVASRVRTDRGVGIGSTEREVRAAYAPLRQKPHKYEDAPAKNLFWQPTRKRAGLRFEIDEKGRVSTIHAGTEPSLSLAEGCL